MTVREIEPPSGFLLSAEPQTIQFNKGQFEGDFTFVNELASDIVIEKRDAATNELLPGAVFEVAIDGAVLGTFTTDTSGKIVIEHDDYGQFLDERNETWAVHVTEIYGLPRPLPQNGY